eukprot:CAMPEP_0113483858 /NCGR_PEP_ID=MMETSP0014_2-20120614/23655_1 /TAXON_ID=2857 /ORGANISM="Nitzschia sp." /LENGTH=461 /DNA_ID=CAMNT_0000377427 /DNA_START=83 /DNA_END=1468 /DNA_ORIENTATION=- /assembly_acc=CAM_ASM_000159
MEKQLSWKDTNLALIGSELDHKVKAAAASEEAAWEGIGQSPGTKIWRIENFQVKTQTNKTLYSLTNNQYTTTLRKPYNNKQSATKMEKQLSWKDTNLALIGSELDHKVKAAAASEEAAWEGIGQSPGTKIWRIENFQVKPWPEEQHGEFFRGDTYIVLRTYKVDGSDALKHDIHIWIGSESTQDEYGTAAYKMVEADEFLGGIPVQHRQVEGKESAKFYDAFPTGTALEYLDGGVASGFNHVEPTEDKPLFFRVKGGKMKQLKMSQMAMSVESMNEGDSFILYASKAKVWCWHGKEAGIFEKAQANKWAEHMCSLGTVVTLESGDDEDDDFWGYVGGDGSKVQAAIADEPTLEEFAPVLYKVDADPSKPLTKIKHAGEAVSASSKEPKCFPKSSLDDADVYLVDTGFQLFVWIGSGADISNKVSAMGAADRYAVEEPRANYLPVTILKSGQETDKFLSFFS